MFKYFRMCPIKHNKHLLMATKSQFFVCLLFTGLMFSALPVTAADDEYLKMLEGEAADLQLDNKGQLKQEDKKAEDSASFGWGGELEGENIPSGLAKEDFESVLKKNFYGTYVFFKKLNSTDKDTVYYRYSKEQKPDLENVRNNIMTLLKR